MRLWPQSKPLRRLLVAALALLALVALVLIDQAWVAWDRRFTIAPDTTRITSPLSPEGYPDYLASLNQTCSAGVTRENNAAIPLWEAVGMDPGDIPAYKTAIYRTWGVPESPGPHLKSYKKWANEHGVLTPSNTVAGPATFDGGTIPADKDVLDWEEENARLALWSPAEQPLLARWLADCNPQLDKIVAATLLPRYYVPLVTKYGENSAAGEGKVVALILPNEGSFRICSHALLARAMSRLHAGDTPGFSSDLLATIRLSRLLAQDPIIITFLLGSAIDAEAMRTLQLACTTDRLSAAAADALRAQLERIDPIPSMAHAIDLSERYTLLDIYFACHNGMEDGSVLKTFKTLNKAVPVNYNAALRRANAIFDREARAADLPLYFDRHAEFLAVDGEVNKLRGRGYYAFLTPEDLILCIFINSLANAEAMRTTALVERDLALTALALRSLRAAGNPYPASLADLKTFSAPPDRFTNTPLHYLRKADGYLLYSVGPDLTDNAGIRTKNREKSDISVESTH
jgi:hypothetical protein